MHFEYQVKFMSLFEKFLIIMPLKIIYRFHYGNILNMMTSVSDII